MNSDSVTTVVKSASSQPEHTDGSMKMGSIEGNDDQQGVNAGNTASKHQTADMIKKQDSSSNETKSD